MSGKVIGLPRVAAMVKVGLLCALMAFLAACASKETGSGEDMDTSVNKRELAYGVTVVLPDGWGIAASADASVAEDKEIDEHIFVKGERAGILSIYRAAKEGNQATGGIALFVVNAKKEFIPEDVAQGMTPEACAEYSQMILERDRQEAAQNKAKSPISSWVLSREMINGRLALLQKGLATAPSGEQVNVLYADIYLPNGVGLAVRGAANAEPGTEKVMRDFVNSIRVNR